MFKVKKKSIIYAVIFLLLLASLSFLTPALRTLSSDIFKFPLTLLMLIKREIGGIVFYHRNLIQSERLNKDIDLLKYKLNEADEIYRENQRLKNILSLEQSSSHKVIATKVIGRSPDNWSSLIIVDKGMHSGIKRGFAVISYLGLVGRVIETAPYTSKIILINDPDLGVSAIVQRNRQEGLVCGTMGSYLIMRYLPKDSDVQISDAIVTSGLTEVYPKGLLIGQVVGVGEEFSGLSRYALVKPAVNFSNIEEVLIITQEK